MSDEHQDMQALLLRGIELARAGKKDDARAIFEQVLQADQYNEQAWLWMASVARSTAERREALEIALEINPQNQQARAALEHLGGPRARRKADAARDLAARIGSDEPLTEEDFQPVATPQAEAPEPEPEPELTPEQRQTALARTLIESARAERAAAGNEGDEDAPEAEDSGPTVEVIDVERARQQRIARLLTAVMFVLVAGIALVLLVQRLPALLAGPPPPTESFETRIARLATATPTYDVGVVVSAQPGRDLNIPPSWTPPPTPTASITPPATTTPLPPASYSLIFSRREAESSTYALYTARGDGAEVTALTDGTGDDRDPAIGPDGARVLFVTEIEGRRQVALLPLEGAAAPETPAPSEEPPAGATPAAAETPAALESGPGTPESGPVALTRITASDISGPSWSPDSYRFVFSANLDGDEELYLSDVEGASFIQITRNNSIDRDPVWSPDGDWIVFASDRDGAGQLELYAVRPDGTEVVALTNSQGSSFAPAWSPDGAQIVFVSDRDRDADLYIMRADGTNETLLTRDDEDAEDRAPAWSPDGRWIAFSSNRDSDNFRLFLIDPFVGTVLPVTDSVHDDLGAAWLRR